MEGNSAVSLGHTGEFLLPYSYELDNAPGFEAFFLVWADGDFSVDAAEALLAGYDGAAPPPEAKTLNPGGKTGLTVIQLRKDP